MLTQILGFIGGKLIRFFQQVGETCLLFLRVLQTLIEAPRNIRTILKEMLVIGANAAVIACVMALFTGMILALQTGDQLALYGITDVMGSMVGLAMVKELCPVFIALLVAGRAGSAMAAEIGTMSVSEEIFALRSMGIDPVRFLVMPKFIAACLVVPMLVVMADLSGFLGGALMSHVSVGLDYSTYFDSLYKTVRWSDHLGGLIKCFIFGGTIVVVSCQEGFKTEGGAEQVGRATTRSVVVSFLSIFILDYFLTKLLILVFNEHNTII